MRFLRAATPRGQIARKVRRRPSYSIRPERLSWSGLLLGQKRPRIKYADRRGGRSPTRFALFALVDGLVPGEAALLKLYTARNSICTQKVFITLTEKGAAYETRDIDLFVNEQFEPWYLAINPKGVVPALDHDGRIVIESTLIAEYLDDVLPGIRLTPADPHARARMRLWSKAVDEGLFEATRELSFSAMFREKMRQMTQEQREGRFRNVGDPVKRARFMSTYELGVESSYVYEGIGKFEMAFRTMEKDLSSGSPWLLGGDMSLADINMMPFVARLEYLGLLDV